MLVPLVWVRKIQAFAYFHIFADTTILWTLGVIIGYAVKEFLDNDKKLNTGDVVPLNTSSFLSFVGLAAYMYEGIGLILPVMVSSNGTTTSGLM